MNSSSFSLFVGFTVDIKKTAGVKGTYLVLQVINSAARLILSIVVEDCVSVCPVKGSLYLQHANIHTQSHRLTAEGHFTQL